MTNIPLDVAHKLQDAQTRLNDLYHASDYDGMLSAFSHVEIIEHPTDSDFDSFRGVYALDEHIELRCAFGGATDIVYVGDSRQVVARYEIEDEACMPLFFACAQLDNE